MKSRIRTVLRYEGMTDDQKAAWKYLEKNGWSTDVAVPVFLAGIQHERVKMRAEFQVQVAECAYDLLGITKEKIDGLVEALEAIQKGDSQWVIEDVEPTSTDFEVMANHCYQRARQALKKYRGENENTKNEA